MIIIGSCTVVLIALLYPTKALGNYIDQTPLVATCSAASTVQVFRSLLFIDLISAHDPEVVFGSSFPSDYAADRIYEMNLRILPQFGLRNAAEIGSTVARAVSLVDVFTLPLYYLNTGSAVGEFLSDKGLLGCNNIIERATQFFGFEQSEFGALDQTQFVSYMESIVRSVGDLLVSLGYNTEEKERYWQTLADLLYKAYSEYASPM